MTGTVLESQAFQEVLKLYHNFYQHKIDEALCQTIRYSRISKSYIMGNIWPKKVFLYSFIHGVERGDICLAALGLSELEAESDIEGDLNYLVTSIFTAASIKNLDQNAVKLKDTRLLNSDTADKLLKELTLIEPGYEGDFKETPVETPYAEIKEYAKYSSVVNTLEEYLKNRILIAFEYVIKKSKFNLKFFLKSLSPRKTIVMTFFYGLVMRDMVLCSPATKLFSEVKDRTNECDLEKWLLGFFKLDTDELSEVREYFYLFKNYSELSIPNFLERMFYSISKHILPEQTNGKASPTICPSLSPSELGELQDSESSCSSSCSGTPRQDTLIPRKPKVNGWQTYQYRKLQLKSVKRQKNALYEKELSLKKAKTTENYDITDKKYEILEDV